MDEPSAAPDLPRGVSADLANEDARAWASLAQSAPPAGVRPTVGDASSSWEGVAPAPAGAG
eukprot:950316-Alexandrium_andersonii.AAC.1